MTFTDRVHEQRPRLTKGDLALVDEIMAHPAEAPLWRGEDLARRGGAHPAAATRLAQRLGYDGYLQLREDLRSEHNRRLTGSADRFRAEQRDRGDQGTLATLIDGELQSLAAVSPHVDQQQVDDAADRVVAAGRIFVFGRGNATILAELLDRRLRRFGIATVNLTGSGRDVAERIVPMQQSDLLLAFAFRRAPRDLGALITHSAQTGAASLLITDTLHTIDPAPTEVLSAPRGDLQGFASLTVPMAIVNAIVLSIAQRHSATTLHALDRLDDLLTTVD